MTIFEMLPSLLAVVLAAMASACIIWAIRPLLLRHALAKPNSRSSHLVPTPQGAGIAVIVATLVIAGAIIAFASKVETTTPTEIFAATLFIAIVGLFDDIKSIPIFPRLLLQAIAVGIVVFSGAGDPRIVPVCPLWIERGLFLLCGLWFVNLVNFMDGLDWMTVVEVVPVTGAIIVLGSLGELPASTTIVAAALCGAMVGFAPFNRPVAKIFLGDVGSLPVGLLLGWCLLQLVHQQQLAAALLLPMYYLLDATVTLIRRVIKREPFWAAHRSHFYQRATDNGFSVLRVVSEVFALNILLAALAIASAITPSNFTKVLDLIVGGLAAVLLMYRFTRQHSPVK
jgi:UDP-N-acetylmuramyl pentapeptide phosphotransferase/UDP-N-acetylglucosamine-1-phosphate transferase